jgi:hypothetical protein
LGVLSDKYEEIKLPLLRMELEVTEKQYLEVRLVSCQNLPLRLAVGSQVSTVCKLRFALGSVIYLVMMDHAAAF